MRLEQTIREQVLAESMDLDGRLQQLVRAGLMPQNTLPVLRKAIAKVQSGMALQGAERDVMATFINSMMYIVLGDDAIFNKARAGAKTYATEAKEKQEYDYEGDMAMSQLKSIIANSQRMHDMLSEDTNLPEWVQSKITLAEDYISTASNYMQSEMSESVEMNKKIAQKAGSKLSRDADTGTPDYFTAAKRRIKGLPEEAKDMPFEGPYRTAGERKDKYGNTIKNVAKYLAKKAMKAKEDVYEESEGIHEDDDGWYAHKEMSNQVKRKDWQKGWRYLDHRKPKPFYHQPTKTWHASIKEEILDELSKGTLGRYIKKAAVRIGTQGVTAGLKIAADEKSKKNFDTIGKRERGIGKAVSKLTKESRRAEAMSDINSAKQMNESYKTAFDNALIEYNVKSPSELDESKRKQFFNFVDQEYKKGDK
jgi:hypothetical protein